MHVFCDGKCDRSLTADRAEILNSRYAAEPVREKHVENSADHQLSQDADRHIALRVFRLLRSRGNRVKTDIREEDDSRCAQNSHDPTEMVADALGRHIN